MQPGFRGDINPLKVGDLVTPQKWKKEFQITGDKNSSIAICKRLFPDIDLRRTERCRKDDDGMIESFLLAEYARRKLQHEMVA